MLKWKFFVPALMVSSIGFLGMSCTHDEVKLEEPIAQKADAPGFKVDDKTGIVTFTAEVVYFEFDSANLTDAGKNQLNLLGQHLQQNPKKTLKIEGHCDERGSTEYNLALGERRAESVRKYVADLGIESKRLEIVSLGEEKPAKDGRGEEIYSKNRRAEFIMTTSAGE